MDAKENGNRPIHIEMGNAGLTKREYFAGLAMQGILGSTRSFEEIHINGLSAADSVAQRSRAYADALLAELAK